MRVPTPPSLLVEHPILPIPFTAASEDGETVPVSALDHDHRRRIAVQLIAAAALLADFELWPGRRNLLSVEIRLVGDGPRALLPNLPMPLSRVWSALGGGDLAASITREAVVTAVGQVTGLDLDRGSSVEPGFYLDGVLGALLDDLERPLDPVTARALWMWRWRLPELPEQGDTMLLPVPEEAVAKRIGAALWSAAVRSGREAVFELANAGREPILAADRGTDDLRVVAGVLDGEILSSLVDRSGSGRATLVAIGVLPDGWTATENASWDSERISAHLGIAGIPPARRTRVLEGLSRRFDPHSRSDRRSLTASARRLYAKRRLDGPGASELTRIAGLDPDGVPTGIALEIARASKEELRTAAENGEIVIRTDRVMAPNPGSMRLDPRHAELALRLEVDDPKRRLHQALASGDGGPVLAWARERLDDLDAVSVRGLLSQVKPGVLGAGVQETLVEACLYLRDVHGARRALRSLDPGLARPWQSWVRLLDRAPGRVVELPEPVDVAHAAHACAEIAVIHIRRDLDSGRPPGEAAMNIVRKALDHLRGANRRWIEIRLASHIEPERFDDPEWRLEMTGGHPELAGLVLFERATRALKENEYRLARQLLGEVMAVERSPGRLAMMQINLGTAEAELENPDRAEALTVGAYRLFEAAGFRHRAWDALYNLAAGDIDRLRLRRAEARLDALAKIEDSVFVALERARLLLARGDLEELRLEIDDLVARSRTRGPMVARASAFLAGVAALLEGRPKASAALLDDGGEEGKVWRRLALAVAGADDPNPQTNPDPWGVGLAVDALRRLADETEPLVSSDEPGLREALAVALCHELSPRPGWPKRELRLRVAKVLHVNGLTGWASRIRWEGGEIVHLCQGLSKLVACGGSTTEMSAALDDLSDTLGVDGLVVRSAFDGVEMLRTGEGTPGRGFSRGAVEVAALGGDAVPDGVWELLVGLLATADPPSPMETSTPEETVRIDGPSPAAEGLREEIRRAATAGYTVLVHGETGSGKEVVAREIHRLSDRPGHLVSVNIAAIPANLLEAELFGSVKGAFTGAERSRRGLVTAAEGGTLFLDEVGDLDVALQVKLLRFLESGEIRAVGADRSRTVDVRVICATHRNLHRRVREGRFREDLYYRIGVAVLEVPPLRERVQDIPVLRSIFEGEASKQQGLRVSPWSAAAEEALLNHRWPGNVRELKHTVEVAMARAAGRRIGPEHLPLAGDRPRPRGTWEQALGEFKTRFLTDVLTRHRGNRSAASRELGISRQALLYQIKKLDLTDL